MLNASLAKLLNDSGVTYATIHHRAAGPVDARTPANDEDVARCVVLCVDGGYALAVVPAAKHVDLERFLDAADAQSVMVAREMEFNGLFPGCEVGAEPPFGQLFGIPLWVDEKLAHNEWIAFRGGTHNEVVRMRFADYVRLAQPRIAAFAVP